MSLETIRDPPSADTLTPLSAHQSQTPASFFSGKPVLHYHNSGCRVSINRSCLECFPLRATEAGVNGHTNGESEGSGEEATVELQGIDIWVTSERFIFYNFTDKIGISIPYPSITLHALNSRPVPQTDAEAQSLQSLYMQLSTVPPSEDDGDNTIELTVTPLSNSSETPAVDLPSSETPAKSLFNAVTACSNLHPDLVGPGSDAEDEDDEGGDPIIFEGSVGYESGIVIPAPGSDDAGLPPPFPGSGGWITAENVEEYFDEEGNWRGRGADTTGESLGPGAGNVRARAEGDDSMGLDTPGDAVADDQEETKWRRTE
ncbi:MAG: hypothetical protein M1817_000475 [Caeruleum heppii]|nr:MAG: hypothetical protein M1817_000475 [Caeruleum heppii]